MREREREREREKERHTSKPPGKSKIIQIVLNSGLNKLGFEKMLIQL